MEELRIEVIELRGAGGLGVFLRVNDDQHLYRVAPVRDPDQPRFWCLAAFECSSCGIPIDGNAIWAGWWGSSQGELPAIFDTIKADAADWLRETQCAGLRRILTQPRPAATLAHAPGRDTHPRHGGESLANATKRAS
jgi:hypothetical protein